MIDIFDILGGLLDFGVFDGAIDRDWFDHGKARAAPVMAAETEPLKLYQFAEHLACFVCDRIAPRYRVPVGREEQRNGNSVIIVEWQGERAQLVRVVITVGGAVFLPSVADDITEISLPSREDAGQFIKALLEGVPGSRPPA